MTYPTPEEINKIAKECGLKIVKGVIKITPAGKIPVYTGAEDNLQAFATRMIEIGSKMQREKDADLCVSTYKDYFGNELPCFDTTFEASLAIRNNTGEEK